MHKNYNKLTNKAVINADTGELLQFLTVGEDIFLNKNYTSTSITTRLNEENKFKSTDGFYIMLNEMCGNFYHNYYNKLIPHKYIFRYLYLCTFMNYKGYIEYGKARGENKLSSKKDIKEILNLKDQQFYETYNYLLENEMIIEDEAYIKINSNFCSKGTIKRNNDGVVRMFNNAIKYLYENSNPIEHNKIGMLIKLLPYVHFDTNIICSNPKEENVNLIKPLKQKEILEILNITKPTINSLMKITIMDKTEYAFIKLSNGSFKNVYIINPRFMFKGKDFNRIQYITNGLKYFKLGLN